MIERVTYTTQPSAQSLGRYITVFAPDGSYVSRHINMEECTESALAHAQAAGEGGTYRFVPPEKHMSVQIIKTIPGRFTGSFIANPALGRVNAIGVAPTWNTQNPQNNDPYDLTLGGTRTIPALYQGIQFADPPNTTSSVSVNTQAELNAALSNGRQITVNAGSYSSINLSGLLDIDMVVNNNAIFSGGITASSGTRLRVSGGQFSGRLDLQQSVSHFTASNVVSGAAYIQPFGGLSPSHVTLVRCRFNSALTDYGIFSTALTDHLMVCSCEIINTGETVAGVRTASNQSVIYADNRIYSQGNRCFRLHANTGRDADLILFVGNQFESDGENNLWMGPTVGGGAGDAITRIYFQENTAYFPVGGFNGVCQCDTQNGGGIDDVTVVNNDFFTPYAFFTNNEPTNFSESGNTYNAYATPPVWNGGPDH